MPRKLSATVGTSDLNVHVERRQAGQWRVVVDGREHLIDAVQVSTDTWSLVVDGQSHLVDVSQRETGALVAVGNTATLIEVVNARRKRLARAVAHSGARPAGEVVKAPIAGKVIKLLVSEGDDVSAGDVVIVLEAMKMENEIRAARGGKVKRLHASPGSSVETGAKLITLS